MIFWQECLISESCVHYGPSPQTRLYGQLCFAFSASMFKPMDERWLFLRSGEEYAEKPNPSPVTRAKLDLHIMTAKPGIAAVSYMGLPRSSPPLLFLIQSFHQSCLEKVTHWNSQVSFNNCYFYLSLLTAQPMSLTSTAYCPRFLWCGGENRHLDFIPFIIKHSPCITGACLDPSLGAKLEYRCCWEPCISCALSLNRPILLIFYLIGFVPTFN